jgi:hypothetical protein
LTGDPPFPTPRFLTHCSPAEAQTSDTTRPGSNRRAGAVPRAGGTASPCQSRAILLPIGEGNRILDQIAHGKVDELIAKTYRRFQVLESERRLILSRRPIRGSEPQHDFFDRMLEPRHFLLSFRCDVLVHPA